MANNFNYYSPTEVVFGKDTQKETGAYIKKYGGTKVLILYGSDRVLTNGLMDAVVASIKEVGLDYRMLGGVVPNPRISKVYEAIALGQEMGTDFILAVGGGSVIDTAKAVGYGLVEPDKDVWDLFDHSRQAAGCLPIASVLTIAAAGSETSPGSVITNEDIMQKRAYDDDISRPKFAIMNPELTATLPDYQTQSGCTDIMMHTMERYFTNSGSMEITDVLAEALLKTVMKNAQIVHADPTNYEARAEIMWAGSLAHNDLTSCGNGGNDFTTHQLEHELGAMFDVTHGAGLAAMWPSWARYVYKNNLHRFVRFATHVMDVAPEGTDEEIALKGIAAMEDFYHSIDMPVNLKELGVAPTDEQCRQLAKGCALSSGGSHGAAMVLYEEDMYQIYKMAL